MSATVTDVAAVRRWLRKAQRDHRERGETFGTFYVVLLTIAIVGGMFHRELEAVFRPRTPGTSVLAAAGWVAVVLPALYLALHRIGPVSLSRPAASWLLTAPVDRRRLLAPSLGTAAILAALAGALAGTAIAAGHPGPLVPVLGALTGVGVLLIAVATQNRTATAGDAVAYSMMGLGFVALVADVAVDAPRLALPVLGVPVTVLAALDLIFLVIAVRGLGRTRADRILESARTAGTLADSALGVEPSFLTDMVERHYWQRRRLRSRRLAGRLPVLTAQDLLLVLRRPRRLVLLFGAAGLPALLIGAPGWLLGVVVLLGALVAGGTTGAAIRTDAANPYLLRMLGFSSRDAIGQRLWVPGVLAGSWCAVAFGVLTWLDALPPGPWLALGLALGPIGAVAAVRRARVGFVDNTLLPLDTPMGQVATGPTLFGLAGFDLLLLGLPTVVQLAQGVPLSTVGVVVQAAVGLFGARAYVTATTETDRVELS